MYKVLREDAHKDIYFKLEETANGIVLVAHRVDGSPVPKGRVLGLLNTGAIARSVNVSTDIGLELDEDGRVMDDLPKQPTITSRYSNTSIRDSIGAAKSKFCKTESLPTDVRELLANLINIDEAGIECRCGSLLGEDSDLADLILGAKDLLAKY